MMSGNQITATVKAVATIQVHVIPNAKNDKIAGDHGDAIKITLRAAALEGKANAALRCFLAEQLNVPQRAIVLVRGQRSRNKVIRVERLSEEAIRRSLMTSFQIRAASSA